MKNEEKPSSYFWAAWRGELLSIVLRIWEDHNFFSLISTYSIDIYVLRSMDISVLLQSYES